MKSNDFLIRSRFETPVEIIIGFFVLAISSNIGKFVKSPDPTLCTSTKLLYQLNELISQCDAKKEPLRTLLQNLCS